MNRLPVELIDSLRGVAGFDKHAFETVHQPGKQVTAIRINPAKIPGVIETSVPVLAPVPWTKYGYYLSERPSFTFDPLFHAGAYYVQDASSMILEQALEQTVDLNLPLIVLDLCAAPGGKSTHIQSLLSKESVLVTNEVIRNRVNVLSENITKWGAANAIVTNNDPADFTGLEAYFDVIIVDAPCSGSGLFRKDPDAILEWSLQSVAHCSLRQQRILTDVWPALKPGGILIYSTCSYSTLENEGIADWLASAKEVETIRLDVSAEWKIIESQSTLHKCFGYRFYPYLLDGEGFYLACFTKAGAPQTSYQKKIKYQPDKRLVPIADKWLKPQHNLSYYQHKEQVFAMPENTLQVFLQIQAKLNIRKAGFKVGDWARDEIIPDHALALSEVYNQAIAKIAVDKAQAIGFLRRVDFALENLSKGWLMICYKELSLGWIKSVGSRFNNYYPKEWRIRS